MREREDGKKEKEQRAPVLRWYGTPSLHVLLRNLNRYHCFWDIVYVFFRFRVSCLH